MMTEGLEGSSVSIESSSSRMSRLAKRFDKGFNFIYVLLSYYYLMLLFCEKIFLFFYYFFGLMYGFEAKRFTLMVSLSVSVPLSLSECLRPSVRVIVSLSACK